MEAGPPHKREFTVTCHMEDLTEKGPAAFYAFFVKLTVFVLEFELDVMFWQLWEAPKRRLKRRLRRKWWPDSKVCRAPLKSHGYGKYFAPPWCDPWRRSLQSKSGLSFMCKKMCSKKIPDPQTERQTWQSEKLDSGEDLLTEEKPAEHSQHRLHSDDVGAVQGARLRGHVLQHR